MEPRPFISVLCPTFNHPEHFAMTLATIAAQTFRNFNVIVRDDCGPFEAEYRRLVEVFSEFTPTPITYIRAEKNEGIGVNRQRLLEAATGEYVTFIDDDDQFFSVEVFQTFATNILAQRQQGHIVDLVHSSFVEAHEDGMRLVHAPTDGSWVHGKMFRLDFLRAKGITFPDYRAFEDGAFNHVAGRLSEFQLVINDAPSYLWCWTTNSITRGQDYLHVMLPTYTDSFWRAYKILEPIKGRDNLLELLIAPLCHTYFYLMGIERRYEPTDEYLVRTYEILSDIIVNGKILDVIDNDTNRYNQFRAIYNGARNGAMNQDPTAWEFITFNEWLKLHFNVSLKRLELPENKNFVYKVPTTSMYADRDKKEKAK